MTRIWKSIALILLGILLGFGSGVYFTAKLVGDGKGQNIVIKKLKLKGRDINQQLDLLQDNEEKED
jgi:hypothetical protein